MTTAPITGSNKGLGHETACQLVGAGHTVYIGPGIAPCENRMPASVPGLTPGLESGTRDRLCLGSLFAPRPPYALVRGATYLACSACPVVVGR
jgi:hypothetical protein